MSWAGSAKKSLAGAGNRLSRDGEGICTVINHIKKEASAEDTGASFDLTLFQITGE